MSKDENSGLKNKISGEDFMRVTDVNAKTIKIPLKDSKEFATRKISHRYYTIVEIYTDES